MAMRHGGSASFATRAAAEAACHLGVHPGLIDEDEPLGFQFGLAIEPGLPPPQNVGAALLGRVRRLFLSVMA